MSLQFSFLIHRISFLDMHQSQQKHLFLLKEKLQILTNELKSKTTTASSSTQSSLSNEKCAVECMDLCFHIITNPKPENEIKLTEEHLKLIIYLVSIISKLISDSNVSVYSLC